MLVEIEVKVLDFSHFKDNPLFSKPSNIDKTKPKAVFVISQSEAMNVSESLLI